MSIVHGVSICNCCPTLSKTQNTIGIIGGGLAGIAAAEAVAMQGHQVHLFERASGLGGRAASLFEPTQEQWIDSGQHLLLGCCTEILALNRRLSLETFFERSDTIPLANLKQQHWSLTASPLLPKRWQLLPSFIAMPQLPMMERLKTGRLLKKLREEKLPDITIEKWFKQHYVPPNTLEAFWLPLILGALSEMPDHVAAKAVQKVVQDTFMTGRENMAVYLSTVPLREIYHDATSKTLTDRGITIHFFKRLQRLHWEKNNTDNFLTITALEFSDGTCEQFDRYILAMPAFQLWKVLEASDLTPCAKQLGLERFEPGAITTVHLWLDRPILESGKRFCTLSGGIGQFLAVPNDNTRNYHTVVISAAHRLLTDTEMMMSGSKDLAEMIVEQLKITFGIPTLQLLHCRTTTCFEAVFSPKPEIYAQHPASKGLFTNGALAGDWTQTGLPATLEGAVRSGLAAVQEG